MRTVDAIATKGGKVTLETITAADAPPLADLPPLVPKRATPKRGYSTRFRPKGDGERYLVDRIPSALWRDVRRKAQREGISLRALILTLLEDWTSHGGDR